MRRHVPVLLSAVLAGASPPTAAAYEVPYMTSGSDTVRQGFVRVVNRDAEPGMVWITAIDDAGRPHGPVALSIDGGATVHFNSQDLEDGNADKGLPDGVGPGSGDWRLELVSDVDLEVLAYLRTRDGFLTAMHDVVPPEGGRHRVPILNPASNNRQVSLLRLTNLGTESAAVRITGIDDAGAGGAGAAEATVAAGATRTLTAADLERMGLGDGAGKWRLLLEADRPLRVVNLLRSPTGHLTNLSTAPATAGLDAEGGVVHRVPLMPAAGGHVQGFVRVTNHGDAPGEVRIRAIDDGGTERGTLRLDVGAGATAPFNSDDLAGGNAAKGLTGSVSAGEGDWRLEMESELPIEVLAYARTRDGFVTSLHDAAPAVGRDSHVAVFNPGSNDRQVSSLRLVNAGETMAEVAIIAVDDDGWSPGGEVSLVVPAGGAVTHTSLELEEGTGSGLVGGIGDGAGKWRLRVTSRVPVRALSLIRSPTGHLTNLSTATRPPAVRRVALATDVEVPRAVRGVGEVTVASLGGDSAEAPVDGSSSVLVASDEGGTVLLAVADEDGGYLDGGSGAVDIGIESTALALAAAASGHQLHGIDRSLAEAIRGQADFGRLVEFLTGLMASDRNYLDRLYDYPEAVALVRAVASGAVEAQAGSGAGAASGRVPVRAKRAFGARALSSGQVRGFERGGEGEGKFYCWEDSDNKVIRVVGGVVKWIADGIETAIRWVLRQEKKEEGFRLPCSPWARPDFGSELLTWTWYEDPAYSQGLESISIDWANPVLDVAADYYDVAIDAAWNGVPFLAVTTKVPEGLKSRYHAIGNPNYVNFAMEAHTADGYDGWTYVPGNSTALRKLFSSGAVHVSEYEVPGGLRRPEITKVQFTRHRFDFTSDEEHRRLVSWVNALDLGLAAANLLTGGGLSGARKALKEDGWKACVKVMAEGAALNQLEDVERHWTRRGSATDSLWNFYNAVGGTVLTALEAGLTANECRTIALKAAGLSAAASMAGRLSPGSWVKLPFDIANETLPVAVAYFSPNAGGVTYHLTWSREDDGWRQWYLSRVSKSAPPAAQFAYEQRDRFKVALDASATEPGDSDVVLYNWFVDGKGIGESGRPTLEHDFGAAGTYLVSLVVRDRNGETSEFSSGVQVPSGPTVSIRDCAVAGEGRVRLSADFGHPGGGDIDLIEWCPKADCAEGEWTDSNEVGFVDEVVLDGAYGTHARVAAVDEWGKRTESACKVEGASVPPELADSPGEVGETFSEPLRSGGSGLEMVVIPAGSFRMGCVNDDGYCDSSAFPVHEVTIPRAFAVSKYEVTFDDYDRFTQATGKRNANDLGRRGGRLPVTHVSWQDAKDYLAWLSSETGAHYRLPSEAEWEYAARAGTETHYHWGNHLGWNRANCSNRVCGDDWSSTAPVGSFAPNAFGLHDVLGNVYEWVEDCYHDSYEGAPSDGVAWTTDDCSFRVMRGASYTHLRGPTSWWRYPAVPWRRDYDTGFRVARTLTP